MKRMPSRRSAAEAAFVESMIARTVVSIRFIVVVSFVGCEVGLFAVRDEVLGVAREDRGGRRVDLLVDVLRDEHDEGLVVIGRAVAGSCVVGDAGDAGVLQE